MAEYWQNNHGDWQATSLISNPQWDFRECTASSEAEYDPSCTSSAHPNHPYYTNAEQSLNASGTQWQRTDSIYSSQPSSDALLTDPILLDLRFPDNTFSNSGVANNSQQQNLQEQWRQFDPAGQHNSDPAQQHGNYYNPTIGSRIDQARRGAGVTDLYGQFENVPIHADSLEQNTTASHKQEKKTGRSRPRRRRNVRQQQIWASEEPDADQQATGVDQIKPKSVPLRIRVYQPAKEQHQRAKSTTSGPDKFRCNIENCVKEYHRASELNRHKAQKHAETHRKFRCAHSGCPREYFWEKDLAKHAETHKDREHRISLDCGFPSCLATFTRVDNRQRHMRLHHGCDDGNT